MYNHDVDAIVDQYVTRIPVSVLLIDDEFLIGEAMRIKLSSETDIVFNYCKEPDKALAAFQEVLKLQPGNTPALVNVARIQQQGKKKEEILQLVRDQIKAAPDSAGNLMLLATMLMTEKQYDEALQLTRKVQELGMDHVTEQE